VFRKSYFYVLRSKEDRSVYITGVVDLIFKINSFNRDKVFEKILKFAGTKYNKEDLYVAIITRL